ncbi:MAG: hypothetical protein ABI844_04020 [Saprospiraceae bacterium]
MIGVILCGGGQSSRMGEDNGLLRIKDWKVIFYVFVAFRSFQNALFNKEPRQTTLQPFFRGYMKRLTKSEFIYKYITSYRPQPKRYQLVLSNYP